MVSSVIHVEDVNILFSELCVCSLSLLSLDFSSLWQKVFKNACVVDQLALKMRGECDIGFRSFKGNLKKSPPFLRK